MKKLAYVSCILAAFVYLCIPVTPASALSCAPRDLKEDFSLYDAIFTGDVLDNTRNTTKGGGSLSMKVIDVYKGTLKSGEVVDVRYQEDMGGTMSWAEKGHELLIFAMQENNVLATSLCTGSLRIDNINKQDKIYTYGFESWNAFQAEFDKLATQYKPTVKEGAPNIPGQPANSTNSDPFLMNVLILVVSLIIPITTLIAFHRQPNKKE